MAPNQAKERLGIGTQRVSVLNNTNIRDFKHARQVDRDPVQVIHQRLHCKCNLAASTRVQRACGLVVQVGAERHGHAIGRIQAGDSMLFLGRALVIAHVRVRFALARGS